MNQFSIILLKIVWVKEDFIKKPPTDEIRERLFRNLIIMNGYFSFQMSVGSYFNCHLATGNCLLLLAGLAATYSSVP